MNEIIRNEVSPEQTESREKRERGRDIAFYLFRHAQATGQESEAELTEQGRKQAEEAAENLLEHIIEQGGGIIKFLSSPTTRAKQTAEIIQRVISKIIIDKNVQNVRLITSTQNLQNVRLTTPTPPRKHDALKSGGVVRTLKKLNIDDPMDHWLQHPDVLEGKSPAEIASRVQKIIDNLQKMADRLPRSEEKIYYVGVTHETPQAALLNQISKKTLNDFGGQMSNCESIRIELKGNTDEPPTISFRDQTIAMPVNHSG